ncbi:MAG: S8 family serine peptidase [Candidatus Latescibacterota bacterium]
MVREKEQKFSALALIIFAVIGMMSFADLDVSAQSRLANQSGLTVDEPSPVGCWQSVDFVEKIEDFVAGQKMWKGDLFLKELNVYANGSSSLGLTWGNGNFSGKMQNDTVSAPYYVKAMGDSVYLFFPWFPSTIGTNRTTPYYYVLKKISDQPKSASSQPGYNPPITPISSVNSFQDVRWKDMSGLSLASQSGLVTTLTFNEKTLWPAASKMPGGDDPKKTMDGGKNPGLGIRELHRQGITGKGVSVAIIDQPLYSDHPEFVNKLAAYYDTGCNSESSMHGPAVASLLVGGNCGTAPDAKLYFAAAPSWTGDSQYYAKALDWIIEQNEKLPAADKIRVVSVSAAPSGPGSPFTKNLEMWSNAFARAEAKGIMILDCTQDRGFIGPCYYETADPENISKCKPGFPSQPMSRNISGKILVPASPRTTAEEYIKGECSYQYTGVGGLSWAIPYCAGVLAMGWQIKPGLTPQEMRDLLFRSAYTDTYGNKIINPAEFIRMVQSSPAGVQENSAPGRFRLNMPYPNPFNPSTVITCEIPESAKITLKIYNLNGQVVKTLADDVIEKGQHRFEWDGMDHSGKQVASGTYFFRLESGTFSQAQKIALVR